MIELLITAGLLVFGLTCGTYVERKHFESLRRREKLYLNLSAVSTRKTDPARKAINAVLVTGSAAISIDYFKNFSGVLRNLFGGRVGAYESLIDRARREAVLRMKEQAAGFDEILNTRIETSSIGGENPGKNSVVSVEAIAYGTAVKYHVL